MKIHEIAHITYEANRAYRRYTGEPELPAWEDAPGRKVAGLCNGVAAILRDPDLTPELQHKAWLAEKAADGWTWGAVEDAAAKEHPCILPYDELPPEQQVKDHLFGAIVRALIPYLDVDQLSPLAMARS